MANDDLFLELSNINYNYLQFFLHNISMPFNNNNINSLDTFFKLEYQKG